MIQPSACALALVVRVKGLADNIDAHALISPRGRQTMAGNEQQGLLTAHDTALPLAVQGQRADRLPNGQPGPSLTLSLGPAAHAAQSHIVHASDTHAVCYVPRPFLTTGDGEQWWPGGGGGWGGGNDICHKSAFAVD